MADNLVQIGSEIASCRMCSEVFHQSRTAHDPRPVFWVSEAAPILIAGQAPGQRVHESGRPFDDRSGDRLRDWMGITRETFYDRTRISVLPMAFCFPGYDPKGADLPPPRICASTWHGRVMAAIRPPELILLVGGYAQKWHLGPKAGISVSDTVSGWRAHAPRIFPLPHPSWRNTGWLRKHEWFEQDLVPRLRARVAEVLDRQEGRPA